MRMPEQPEEPPQGETGGRRRRWLRVLGGLLVLLLALAGAFLLYIDSEAGHRYIARRIAAMQFENGLKIEVGRIEGSIWTRARLVDLRLSDPRGPFLTVPSATLDWRPLAYLSNHVDVRSLDAAEAHLLRAPAFKPSVTKGPILPDIDIDIARLHIARLTSESAVTGSKQVLTLGGTAHIADRRAQADLQMETIGNPATNLHDRIALHLDAVPDDNRLAFSLDVDAPAGGVVAKLAGMDKSMRLRAGGSGDWRRWDGNLSADVGGTNAARLAVAAREGNFAFHGPIASRQLLPNAVSGLFGGSAQFALLAKWRQRHADLNGQLSGTAGRLSFAGGVDLGRNLFRRLRLDYRQSAPGALMPNVAAIGFALRAMVDGPFARPEIAYTLDASTLKVGGTTITGLSSTGLSAFDGDYRKVPVNARASAISGLDAIAGGPLGAVSINGDLALQWPRIVSDNLHIRAQRIDAKAIVVADTSKGFYAGTFAGRVNDYRVRSVGLFDLDTQAKIESVARGGFALVGQVRARSTRLFDEGVRDFLGGSVIAAARLVYGPDSVLRFDQLRMQSPNLTISNGSGTYGADGRIALSAAGRSRDYGAVTLALSGTIAQPSARLTAERAGMGIGLADIRAELQPRGSGWHIDASAASDVGPVSARLLLTRGAALAIDVERADVAGIGLSGRLTRLASGPFEGQLVASGQGVNGKLLLDAAGRYQHLVVNLRASNMVLPGSAKVSVGRALIDADAVLYDRPRIVADVQLAQAHYKQVDISAMRVQVNYRDGAGSVRGLAEGSTGVPFRLAVNGDLQPQLWRLALTGKVNGISVASAQPALIVPRGGRYELQRSRFNLDRGSIALAGTFGGSDLQVKGTLDKVDVALIEAFKPGLGLGGLASGDFAYQSGSPFPTIDARLAIAGFSHTTATSVSPAMDINLRANLLQSGGDIRAVARMGVNVVGRVQLQVTPASTGDGWSSQLAAGRVQGGIRYTGPADPLFAFAMLPDQRLSGPVALAADITCTLSDPCLNGVLGGKSMVYENGRYGTRLTRIAVNGRFTGERLEIDQLTANAGDGTISGKGAVSLSAASGYPANVSLDLQNARLADSDELRAAATGSVMLAKAANQPPVLSGEITLPATRYQMVRQGAARVPVLEGVRFKQVGPARVTGDAAPPGAGFSSLGLDLHIVAPNRMSVSGMGLESEWRADLRVTGTSDAPRLAGTATLQRGSLEFAGKSFTLTEGRIEFPGGGVGDAQLRLSGEETFDNITVALNVTGSASRPQITFTSTPGLPQDEILSRVLFGSSVGNLTGVEALQLAASLSSLRGSGNGLNPLGKLQSATGFDRLRILAADQAQGRGTALALGKHIGDRLYIELVTDARGYTATQIEIALNRSLSILSQAGGANAVNVGFRFRKTY